MIGKITLKVVAGPMKGTQFEFNEHDTLIFGRRKRTCHLCLAKDPKVSRHHFVLEINPPEISIRDLGSMNGTLVNGVAIGRRTPGAQATEVPPGDIQMIGLNHDDVIRVGDTELRVSIETSRVCTSCGNEIKDNATAQVNVLGESWCDQCRRERESTTTHAYAYKAVCRQCGKDVLDEIGLRRIGEYICRECQQSLTTEASNAIQSALARPANESPAETKQAVDGYTIGEKLGSGGMGCVYQACRNDDGSVVAVKLMLSKVAINRRARERFLRESRTTMQLSHENIVRFLDCGATTGAFYFVTECCNSGSLRAVLRERGKMPWQETVPMLLDVLRGLAYAHKMGFVHRDIKPSNILLHEAGGKHIAKIADFGLAKNFQAAGLSGMTTTGNFAGTLSYMPREQLTDFKYITPASDVWSSAATFYELLTGGLPRVGRDGADPIEVILDGEHVPLAERDARVPRALASAIDRALAVEVRDRYSDAETFLTAVEKALSDVRSE
jgi:eukaryotic-like serine/threonine-protein kinase